ncbi:hypothetical protein U0070_015093 [Myodes glareolus]|uniref:Uncharacterized protein n=1 Tax=Myodes glareolus TaxID=447135 RepID=A0AAW0JZC2_MYOGA
MRSGNDPASCITKTHACMCDSSEKLGTWSARRSLQAAHQLKCISSQKKIHTGPLRENSELKESNSKVEGNLDLLEKLAPWASNRAQRRITCLQKQRDWRSAF